MPITALADGILNLSKPSGPTSFKMVADVRRLTGQRRVGHGGTLDPIARGVLPILLGAATRLADFVHVWPKTYRAEVQFGAISDTYDGAGSITKVQPGALPSRDQVEEMLPEFTGSLHQKPPVYSALKLAGEPSYKSARRGEPLEPAARPVHVKELRLLALDESSGACELEICAGKGVYVRSLAHDLGERLGCGAYLARLTRVAYGPLQLFEAVTLEQLALAGDGWPDLLLPTDLPVKHWPAVHLDPVGRQLVIQGRPIPGPQPSVPGRHRLLDVNGETLLGWGELEADGFIHPRAVFAR